MSAKWASGHSESGILRKSDFKEKKEELLVFGYSCKLFRDDDKALHVDQGKHLIPWMGDESLKIDRYDARGALHELSSLEAPPGGFDWRVELTRTEQDVEQLCDEERYRALHTDEDEEEMYKEEELKRLHAAGYGQVGFNYEASVPPPEPPPQEVDEPFLPTATFKALLPPDIILPETQKQNAIIEKTAKFIASQGTQMEILIKAKQGDNPQFQFLNKDSCLHVYYRALIALVKAGKWPEKPPDPVEEKHQPVTDEYLHPSLASTVIESAPSIPSIAYRPSADCDYTLLVSRLRGSPPPRDTPPPPGTAPLALPPAAPHAALTPHVPHAATRAHIVRAPVLVAQPAAAAAAAANERVAAPRQVSAPAVPTVPPAPVHSTGLSLMSNYNSDTGTDTDSEDSSSDEGKGSARAEVPPADVQLVIDKMAAYVARNGDEFADIVRAKHDPRFAFLEPGNPHHAYYRRLMRAKRAQGSAADAQRANAVVSFSIKKHKEPDPILPKPALPYESSSDDESESSKQDKHEETEKKEAPKSNIPEVIPVNNMLPVVVYKLEGTQANNLPIVKSFEAIPIVKQMPKPALVVPEIKEIEQRIIEKPVVFQESLVKTIPQSINKIEEKPEKVQVHVPKPEIVKNKTTHRESSVSRSRDRRKSERKREYRSKSASRDSRRLERRSAEREKREKDHDREKKRRKVSKEALESEIISLVDNSDDLIDLTGEHSDCKGGHAGDAEKEERRGGRETPPAGEEEAEGATRLRRGAEPAQEEQTQAAQVV
ncbi:protein suppressor of white apricot isoform X2 [Battus philenor]|uniref:protein suppressor of white apricot isoform X2 n=1 Tax=Battus philenor TaxID=42288 RepID=UPI0035CFC082